MMAGTSPSDQDRYGGIITTSSAQDGQKAVLRYAHAMPTNLDVRQMIDLLRRTADDLERGLPK